MGAFASFPPYDRRRERQSSPETSPPTPLARDPLLLPTGFAIVKPCAFGPVSCVPPGFAVSTSSPAPAGLTERLEVSQLTKTYQTEAGALSILAGIDLAMSPGEAVAITGPSGAGKSTLLYILGLLETPTSGHVRLGTTNPFALNPAAQSSYRNVQVGFVFQDHHLLPQCTVLENVLIPTLATSIDQGQATRRAEELLERVGLRERMHHPPARLSGGERQRAAVCRALINRPRLLLADEPTGNLDRRTAASVGALLLSLAADQKTMLLCVTHSGELAEKFPRRYELMDGFLKDLREERS